MKRWREWIRYVASRTIILFFGLAPASCHYKITGPALWNHSSSYAFEAWLVMWIISIGIACGAIWLSWQD